MTATRILCLAVAGVLLVSVSSAVGAERARQPESRKPSLVQTGAATPVRDGAVPLPRRKPEARHVGKKNTKEKRTKEKGANEKGARQTRQRSRKEKSRSGATPATSGYSDAPAARARPPAQNADATPSAPPEEPAVPTVTWSTEEVLGARARCVELLAPITAEVAIGPAIRAGACGTPAPVVVNSVGTSVRVAMRPPVTLTCSMVAALHAWLDNAVQPAARDLLGEEITAVTGATGYQCRNRADTGRTSEHGFANAIDILGFVTRSGRELSVRDDWGPTERDLGQADDQAGDEPRTEPESRGSAENTKKRQPKLGKRSPAASQAPSPSPRAGKGTSGFSASVQPNPAPDRADLAPEQRFLKRIHREACSPFKTVLGPDANEDHLSHFHLDLAERRNKSSYCR